MLILTRRPGESIFIGNDIKVRILEIKGNQIRVGIDAPQSMRILREEIYQQILEETHSAAEAPSEAGLEGLSEAWLGRTQSEGSSLGKLKVSDSKVSAVRPSTDPEVIKRKLRPRKDEP